MKKAKRIIDLLSIFCLLVVCQTGFCADNPEGGYPSTFVASITLAANATGSISITHYVAKYNMQVAAPCEITFNNATATVYVASQTSLWEAVDATTTIHLEPAALGISPHLWIKNGPTAQKIRFKSYGR